MLGLKDMTGQVNNYIVGKLCFNVVVSVTYASHPFKHVYHCYSQINGHPMASKPCTIGSVQRMPAMENKTQL